LLSLLVVWLCVWPPPPPPKGGEAVASRRGRMEPAVDGRDEMVVALGPGVDADVGRRRGDRVCCLPGGIWWGVIAGGELGGETPAEGDLVCPTRPY